MIPREIVGIKHYNLVEDLVASVYIGILIASITLIYGFYQKYRLWTHGGQKISVSLTMRRLLRLVINGLLIGKVIMHKQGGLIHGFIYVGMSGLFIGTILRFLEKYLFLEFFDTRILAGSIYLIFKLLMNVCGIFVIIGISLALIRRRFKTYKDLPTSTEDYLILTGLLIIVLTGFILSAINTLDYRLAWINNWDPLGYALMGLFINMDSNLVTLIYRFTWIVHLALALAMISSLFFTKLSHIIVSGFFNVFLSKLDDPVIATYKPVDNLDKIIETGTAPGASTLHDFSWKMRLDLDACTQCSRCHNNCPANISGKPLSPMNLVISLRRELHKKNFWKPLVNEIVQSEAIHSCLTCGACIRVCPVLINPVEIIIDFRRNMTSLASNVPTEWLRTLHNMMKIGNPQGFNPNIREEWLQSLINELGIEYAQKEVEYEYLFWLGCNANYDPNIRGVAYALMSLLRRAGIRVALLPVETCCGEVARRLGDELLFREIVKTNSEILREYKFEKLLVICPHGYTIFKHEYKLYGGINMAVEHHSSLLQRLLKEGRISVKKLSEKVTYHDPCYLARWNRIYREPRQIIKNIAEIREMKRSHENTFCCGAGGGNYFYTPKIGERISKIRKSEAEATGAEIIVTACPFCNLMLRSEISDGDRIKVIDIAELVYMTST